LNKKVLRLNAKDFTLTHVISFSDQPASAPCILSGHSGPSLNLSSSTL